MDNVPGIMIRRDWGEWGKVTAVALAVFAVAGAAWGLWQPATTGQVTNDLSAVTGIDSADAAVPAFGLYVIITGVLGAITAGWIFASARRLRGPVALLGAGILGLIGSGVFLVFGNYITQHFRATDLSGDLTAGQHVTLISEIGVGSGVLTAPALALLVYWACALFSSDRAFVRS